MMCAVYAICRVQDMEIKFKRIVNVYSNMPHAGADVSTNINSLCDHKILIIVNFLQPFKSKITTRQVNARHQSITKSSWGMIMDTLVLWYTSKKKTHFGLILQPTLRVCSQPTFRTLQYASIILLAYHLHPFPMYANTNGCDADYVCVVDCRSTSTCWFRAQSGVLSSCSTTPSSCPHSKPTYCSLLTPDRWDK